MRKINSKIKDLESNLFWSQVASILILVLLITIIMVHRLEYLDHFKNKNIHKICENVTSCVEVHMPPEFGSSIGCVVYGPCTTKEVCK